MKVIIHTTIKAPYEKVVEFVQKPALMAYVCRPLQTFTPIKPSAFPETWTPGIYTTRIHTLLGLPAGSHTLDISFPDTRPKSCFMLRDSGGGTLAKTWKHDIIVQKNSRADVRYTDYIKIHAGVATIGLWLYAHILYRWRQHRWRQLAASDFRALGKAGNSRPH